MNPHPSLDDFAAPTASGPPAAATGFRAHALRCLAATLASAAAILLLFSSPALANDPLSGRLLEIEGRLPGFPRQVASELEAIPLPADPALNRQLRRLLGEALVLSNRTAEALQIADRLESDGLAENDDAMRSAALLIRSNVQAWANDSAKAHALANEAREIAAQSGDFFIRHSAALAAGTTARTMGRVEAAFASLEEALTFAEWVESPYRRSCALYQLSVLDMKLKQPEKAYEKALEAYKLGKAANSAYAMARAKMAESAALDALKRPRQELAAMQEAVAISRSSGSHVVENLALVNLADIHLRRKDFRQAHELSRRSLELARESDDGALIAVSKLNVGLALLGMGRIDAGKRLADEALQEYERSGATAEIAETLREYGGYLENAGDHRSALALFHREQGLHGEIALAAREKAVLELQGKYESDKRNREIELLNRAKDLQAAELRNRELEQRVWWMLAAVFGISFGVIAVLHHKLRVTNRLLAQKNVALSQQSSRDPLTALYNRRHFQEFISERPAPTERRGTAEKPVQALLLIDIDHFKQINDQHGHAAGDAVLVAVAHRLREALRETDMIVRWGGEEFLVFVPVAPIERMDEIVLRIMHALNSEPIDYMGHSIRVTASIGYSPMPLPPENVTLDWDGAIGLVDKALYLAKSNGRNRAYGVSGLHPREGAVAHGVEGDLETAWRDGLVDLRVLLGAQAIVPQHSSPHALSHPSQHSLQHLPPPLPAAATSH